MKADPWLATQPCPLDAPGDDARSPLLDARIMMIDDEPLMTELIQAHLEDAGYGNFVVSHEPRQAMALLRRELPGLLLLDLMMPEVSGFELLEQIRADRQLRYTPVIVLTAAAGAATKLRALQLGATDFLSKPVDASELVLRVRNTLAFQQFHERLVNFDAVTGLPNERQLERGVDARLAQQPLRSGVMALLSITVPDCRQLRESVDRATADALARVVAQRIERVAGTLAPATGFTVAADRLPRVARLGETHFALVVDGVTGADAVEALAKTLLADLSGPVQLGLHEVAPLPSVGIAIAPGDGRDAATLRQSADLAATHARSHGGSRYTFASPALNARSYDRLLLGTQLRGAAQRGELRLHYQPKFDLASRCIVGVEALVRWQHPEHGLLQPMSFIPLAEELGFITALGQWVIERALLDAAAWSQAGLGEVKVSVNVAKPQFTAGNLVQVVRGAMLDSGLPAERLVIELTESMLMDDVRRALQLMHELKSLGVTLSIDDFGTGYSSLAYLKRFPLDELKIDRSFVTDLPGASTDVALVRTVIELGHSLGMTVVAEGIETDAQHACLRALGCDSGQGYLFARPVPADALAALLAAGPAADAG